MLSDSAGWVCFLSAVVGQVHQACCISMEVTIGGKGGCKSPVCSALHVMILSGDLAFSSLLPPFLRKLPTRFQGEDLLEVNFLSTGFEIKKGYVTDTHDHQMEIVIRKERLTGTRVCRISLLRDQFIMQVKLIQVKLQHRKEMPVTVINTARFSFLVI